MPENAVGSLLEYGILGLMLVLAIGVIIVLWKDNQKKDKVIREQGIESAKVATGLAHTLDEISETTKDLPEKVKDKIAPIIREGINEIKLLEKER